MEVIEFFKNGRRGNGSGGRRNAVLGRSPFKFNITGTLQTANYGAAIYDNGSMDCERLGVKILSNFTGVPLSRVIICIAILGLIGNVLSAFVLIRKYTRSPRVLLMTTLAMTDLCYLFFTIIDQVMTNIGLEIPIHPAWKFSLGICISYCSTVTIWMVVLVTVDRFIHICLPFKALTLCTMRTTIIQIISMVTFCVVFVTILLTIMLQDVNITKQCWFMGLDLHAPTAEIKSYIPLYFYHGFAYGIPPMSIVILNMLILCQVCKCKPVEEGMPSIDDKQISYILASISISSFCFILPSAILQFMFIRDLKNAVTGLLVVNSSINFLIYNAVGRTFREKLKELWCGTQSVSSSVIPMNTTLRRSTILCQSND